MKALLITALIALVLVAVTQWRALERENAAEAAFPPEGRLLDIGGVKVHAVEMGAGPDLILLHGASGNTRDLTFGFAQSLAENYRVIIMDRPALGWTDHISPEYGRIFPRMSEDPFQQAALLQAAAGQLNVKNPLIVGHSFGGAVAWAWALSSVETAGVVSIAGVANPWPGEVSRLHRVNSSIAGSAFVVPLISAFAPDSLVESTVDSIFAPASIPEGYIDHVGTGLSMRRKTLRGNARQVTSLRPYIVQISQRYGELDIPVEIVHGDQDVIVPLKIHSVSLPDQIAGANLTVIEGAGHMPHHTHGDIVRAAIDRVAVRAGLR